MTQLEEKISQLQKQPILSESQVAKSESFLNNLYDQLDKIEKKLQETNQQKVGNGLEKLSTYRGKSDKYSDTLKKFNDGGWASDEYIKNVNTVSEALKTYQAALTEMRKVSDESLQSLKNYQKQSFDTGDAIATTGLQLQNSIADWQRLGYSISEANELAKNSNIYKNVGDMDISTATEHMVSSVQAWKSEFNDDAVKTSEEVMNRYNKIGNEFAISSADIGEAMETSAAALKAGGNDLNEALGIITAGNIIQQDASTTSSAMKILSLRIRGAKSDLESMGESTDDLADSTSKLREEIKGLTGVDIMADEDTFKSNSIYDRIER